MRRRTHGQAALEYLVTYGWAFVVILVAVGALAYFGIINPSRWIPEKCDLGQQMECVDFQLLDGTPNDQVALFVRNNFGKDITVTRLEVSTGSLPFFGAAMSVTIPAGQTGQLQLPNLPGDYLQQGEKQQLLLHVYFHRAPSGGSHTLAGTLYAAVT